MIDEGYVIQLNEWNLDIEQDHFNYMAQTCLDGAIISPSHPGQTSHIGRNTICSSDQFDLYLEYDTVGNDSKGDAHSVWVFEQPRPPSNCIVGWRFNEFGPSWRQDLFCEFYRNKGMTIRQIFWSPVTRELHLIFLQARKSMEIFLAKVCFQQLSLRQMTYWDCPASANEKGIKVPKQLSVIGMDGIFSGQVSYPVEYR